MQRVTLVSEVAGASHEERPFCFSEGTECYRRSPILLSQVTHFPTLADTQRYFSRASIATVQARWNSHGRFLHYKSARDAGYESSFTVLSRSTMLTNVCSFIVARTFSTELMANSNLTNSSVFGGGGVRRWGGAE